MMTTWVYDICGVIRPMIDPAELTTRSADWKTAATAASQGLGEIDAAIKIIASRNQGPGADAFVARMTNDRSARYAVDAIARASTGFEGAHAASATALTQCLTTMDAISTAAHNAIKQAFASGPWPMILPTVFGIITTTRSHMLQQQTIAETAITNAYKGFTVEQLPDTQPLSSIDDPDRGIVDPDIRAQWALMSESERRAVLEEIVRQEAIANGMDPNTPVRWTNTPGGGFGSWNGTEVMLNAAHLGDPALMHTAVHEMRHALQGKMTSEYESMDAATRAAIRSGAQADPFAQYGSSIDDVDEMSKRDYYSGSNWPRYHGQPVEVDARSAGRESGAGMSYQTFVERMKGAGVPVR